VSARFRWLLGAGLVLAIGCAAPDFHYADGRPGRYADWRGQWVIVNYWAEWCAPCREEIPELNDLWRDAGSRGWLVVGVNFDGITGDALGALIERMGIEFPVVLVSPRAHFGYPMPSVLPSSVIIAPDGHVASTLVGPQTRKSLETAIAASAPAVE
jgi:peroxiredoxin